MNLDMEPPSAPKRAARGAPVSRRFAKQVRFRAESGHAMVARLAQIAQAITSGDGDARFLSGRAARSNDRIFLFIQ